MTKIKMCGMSRVEDIEVVNQLDIEYIGFILVPGRRRNLEIEKAIELKKKLKPSIKAVGVFVNEEMDKVIDIYTKEIIDVIQLHGQESNEYIKELKEKTNAYIIKAFRIETKEDVKKANESLADMVLLDSGIGGTGKTFDWSLLDLVERKYYLAGGLGVDNIEEAIKNIKPYGVDVSSGIETEGLKDKKKMLAFYENATKEENNGR